MKVMMSSKSMTKVEVDALVKCPDCGGCGMLDTPAAGSPICEGSKAIRQVDCAKCSGKGFLTPSEAAVKV